MDLGQVLRIFLYLFGIPLVVLPTLGGGLVFAGFQITRVPNVDFWKCWKVYLAGCCYGFLVLVVVGFGLQRSALGQSSRQAVQLGVFCGMQLLLIPLLLWVDRSRRLRAGHEANSLPNSSRRLFLTAGVAILLTNLVTLGVIMAMRD